MDINFARLKRQLSSRPWLVRFLLVLLAIACVVLVWFLVIKPVSLRVTPLPQSSGRTNFLILGAGGAGHEAPDLTDTLIFVSINASSGQPVLISVPRDLWIPSLRAKINSAYYYGRQKQGSSGGLILAKSAVTEIINQPVHFALVLDFSTFTKAIDLIGGIDVKVDHAFTDSRYPIPGRESDPCSGDPQYLCRFETVTFTAGLIHMDGAAALKFSRSRNAEGDEGTDFARARRQEKVLLAIKDRLLSQHLLTHPLLYRQLYDLLISSVVTDIQPKHYLSLFRLGLAASRQQIKSYSLEDHLYHPPVSPAQDSQWVLLPQDTPQAIYSFVSGLLKD